MKTMSKMNAGNRTGIATAPKLAEEMMQAPAEFPPSSEGDAELLGEVRASYTKAGEPIGTMPPPMPSARMAKSMAKSVVKGSNGAMALLDKLGARLAFERAGTRLWEAMVAKYDAVGSFKGGPSREQLAHIRDEELRHFEMLTQVIERLGGDPTAVTPSANVEAVASKGLPAVLTDPRTDMAQCLDAVLVAELADNDCWPPLLELLAMAGQEEEARSLLCAVESEREHLQCVRMWLAAAQGRSSDAARDLTDAETAAVMGSPAIGSLAGRDGHEGAEAPAARRSQPSSRSRTAKAARKSGGRSTARGKAAGRRSKARA